MGTGGTSGSGSDKTKGAMNIEGYPVKGLSIAGHETCVMFPTLKLAFDIGRFPQQAISHDFLCISHAHMDHIGGLPMYVATRGLFSMKPPTILVPKCIKKDVEQLFEVHRRMDQSELKHNLIGLDVGEEFYLRKDLKVRAFQTYHAIPSQGYVVYSIRQKLKQEYVGLSGNEIKNLKSSGVEITYTITAPEIAFTGDTMSDFIVDQNNTDVLRSRILVMEGEKPERSLSQLCYLFMECGVWSDVKCGLSLSLSLSLSAELFLPFTCHALFTAEHLS
ncbi:hypothetical protein I3842_12G014700 [Carya illinoinensis]|uniref:Metallo-beta-lactamase domain-containing protein n=1 Tax=Carya illinoinensis TaxID=32201 RepID=A0A922IUK1_CARIL|nr:hypothetical protein I3842_12G014700 [Carya illinoinensis]